MVFILSLVLALLLVLLLGDCIKKYANIFYIISVLISLAVIIITWCNISLPAFVSSRILPIFARGGLAGALFVIVMVTGALPNGSKAIKRLMPIRGQLSIMASILTLGHNIAYGKTYFVLLFTNASNMPMYQVLAACCSIVMLIIMLPLFITSFMTVRRKIKAKKWKQLQRLAYIFYALLYCHVILLNYSRALRGIRISQITVVVYTVVFGGYAFCRVLKASAIRHKKQDNLARRQGTAIIGWIFAIIVLICGMNVHESVVNAKMQTVRLDAVEDETIEIISETETLTDIEAKTNEETDVETDTETDVETDTETNVETDTETDTETDINRSEIPDTVETYSDGTYSDGIYTGKALGMNAMITVNVSVENGEITDVVIESSMEDEPYLSDSLIVIDDILATQSTEVDVVSGATYTSGGIIDAVKNALVDAK
jgi:DMSO/TMAO reductase YedYZ heme-binding membrane subunit/uncharacterized protein with FMN-binding domain